MMTFDRKRLDDLEVAYDKAVRSEAEDFWFEDAHFLTSYAKYVIEYIEYMTKGAVL